MSLLKVKNLDIHFHTREGTFKAVEDAGFELDPGQTLGIVGESGSGKSVLCTSVMGLLAATARVNSGSIEFHGEQLLTFSEKQLRDLRGNRISMVFQDPMTSLNPYLKIKNQILESVRLHTNISAANATKQALDMLDEVGLPDPENIMNMYPHQLSGGMRQRVMIAMALINKPDVLIADEPTTALDVTLQAQILKLIKKLQRQYNIAVIFVSHDLGVISGIADYVLVMQKGHIVEQGTSDSLFYEPRHPYTRNLLAAIPSSAKAERYQIVPGTSPLLAVESVSVQYRTNRVALLTQPEPVRAVDEVSLVIHAGETLGLVGESGSGKTTLGRAIMQLVKTSLGSIRLLDKDLSQQTQQELKASRPAFQMVFQDPYASLNPRMTVFDTLAEAIAVRQPQPPQALLQEAIELMADVGLDPAAIRKYPHEFSGGQRQRIAIARALALKPQLLVADEPVSALDVTIQAQILELLLGIVKKHHLSMLFISHDLSVVRLVCDRVAVMQRGKIVETGDTETVFRQPSHPYTQALLAAIPLPDPIRERAKYQAAP